MKELGIRNITLLSEGLNIDGNFIGAYSYIEERLYINEVDTIREFCLWADKYIGGGSERNMEILFQAFINPNGKNVAEAQRIANVIAEWNGEKLPKIPVADKTKKDATPKTYRVPVTRIGYSYTTIEVVATSEEEAESLAIDEAGSIDFSETTSEYIAPDGALKIKE
jgi:NDP-sugar pyrophosphorylase family protein